MFISNILANVYSDEVLNNLNFKNIKSEMLKEINLYRAMLGKNKLFYEIILEDSATRFSKEMVDKKWFAHSLGEGWSIHDKRKWVSSRRNIAILTENIYLSSYLNNQTLGVEAVQDWQLSDIHHEALISSDYQAVGFGVELGDWPLYRGKDKLSVITTAEKKACILLLILYLTIRAIMMNWLTSRLLKKSKNI
ncbi:hypothetical protein CDIK_4093 [Cucumispora dikerogammari]|nr:hypothetical protein CDIK_4093 [Cucumispora dikerogammari]